MKREQQYLARWRAHARAGEQLALSNVAASYRSLGRRDLAARWYRKATASGDGDAMVDWGYCLHRGIGVRRDSAAAKRAYLAAIESDHISADGREEAMYLLAALLAETRPRDWRRQALQWLRKADAGDDYPQAQRLRRQLQASLLPLPPICTCRRWLRPSLRRLACPMHLKPGRGH